MMYGTNCEMAQCLYLPNARNQERSFLAKSLAWTRTSTPWRASQHSANPTACQTPQRILHVLFYRRVDCRTLGNLAYPVFKAPRLGCSANAPPQGRPIIPPCASRGVEDLFGIFTPQLTRQGPEVPARFHAATQEASLEPIRSGGRGCPRSHPSQRSQNAQGIPDAKDRKELYHVRTFDAPFAGPHSRLSSTAAYRLSRNGRANLLA